MNAFDTLFWLLIVMLAVVAYAIEAGIAVRHRMAVLTTLFSVIGAIFYIMVLGDENSLGRAWSTPSIETPSLPATAKAEAKPDGDLANMPGASIFNPAPATPVVEKKVPRTPFSDCDNCPSMIGVFAGRYNMGSPPTEPGRHDTEGPVDVNITYPFAVGRFEITRDQFAMFVEEAKYRASGGCVVKGRQVGSADWLHPGFEQAGNHPVVCVSWRDARAFVGWLSRKTQKTYRLLSEAEWEYMARGGSKTAYIQGNALSAVNANFNRARDGTIPIGYTSANQFSIHDVLGNAWEIVDDCWNPDLSFNNQDGRPTTLRGDCGQRVIKGGAWDTPPHQTRLGTRSSLDSSASFNTVGFRVARMLD